MPIAEILAPLTGSTRDSAVLKTAFLTARPFHAHITALFVRPDPRQAAPYSGVPMSPTVVQDVVDAVGRLARHARQKALTTLRAIAQEENIEIVETPHRSENVTCSFRTEEGDFGGVVGRLAKLADLVVLGPVAPSEPDIADAFLETLTGSDRPVLISPAAPAHIARKVVIAWNDSNEVAHAVTAALPLLVRAETVTILSVRRDDQSPTTRDLCEYLALHGIEASVQNVRKDERSIEEIIVSTVHSTDADLLVIGGYSHSYWREALLGGVTQNLRWHAPCPTFIVH